MDSERADDSWMIDRPGVSGRVIHLAAWAIALVVFELTADPALVVLVGCMKFGWEQLLTARWLKKTDPNRRRGRACRWFYLSWGLWRISIVATILMFAIATLIQLLISWLGGQGPRGNQPPVQFVVVCMVALGGFVLSALTTLIGTISAWRGKVRVWVGREALEARSIRTWPPQARASAPNRLNALLLTAIPFGFIFFIFPPILLLMFAGINAVRALGGGAAAMPTFLVGLLVVLFGGAFALLIVADMAQKRMGADSPGQCWPPQEVTPPSSSQSTFGSAFR